MIVVTGAASGIGKAVTVELRRQGHSVLGVDRHDSPAADESLIADLGTADGVQAALGQLPDGATGLCNVAGLPPTRPGRDVLAVNYLAVRDLTEGYVDRMGDGAVIVNIASLAANRWREHRPQIEELIACQWDELEGFVDRHDLAAGSRSYHLSKEAVVVWTMQHRWTWRDRDIRMNSISPGPVETPIYPDFVESLGERAENAHRLMDRLGQPEDIAPVVSFLFQPAAAWIRGADIPVDGGMSANYSITS